MLVKKYFGFSVFVFLVFIFALALGASLSARQTQTLAMKHCEQTGGSWKNDSYCEKIVNACTPQNL